MPPVNPPMTAADVNFLNARHHEAYLVVARHTRAEFAVADAMFAVERAADAVERLVAEHGEYAADLLRDWGRPGNERSLRRQAADLVLSARMLRMTLELIVSPDLQRLEDLFGCADVRDCRPDDLPDDEYDLEPHLVAYSAR